MEDHQIWWEWVLQPREQNRSRAQNWATRPGQTQTTREDDKLVTSDLEKAALIGRPVNRMEEVGSLIFRSANRNLAIKPILIRPCQASGTIEASLSNRPG